MNANIYTLIEYHAKHAREHQDLAADLAVQSKQLKAAPVLAGLNGHANGNRLHLATAEQANQEAGMAAAVHNKAMAHAQELERCCAIYLEIRRQARGQSTGKESNDNGS